MVVIPEPCFKNSEGGDPELFMARGLSLNLTIYPGFDYGSAGSRGRTRCNPPAANRGAQVTGTSQPPLRAQFRVPAAQPLATAEAKSSPHLKEPLALFSGRLF